MFTIKVYLHFSTCFIALNNALLMYDLLLVESLIN